MKTLRVERTFAQMSVLSDNTLPVIYPLWADVAPTPTCVDPNYVDADVDPVYANTGVVPNYMAPEWGRDSAKGVL